MKGSRLLSGSLTQARLKDVLRYNRSTGVFTWKMRMANNVLAGSVAGRLVRGYRVIRIDGQSYYAARLAWFYVHGEMPKGAMRYLNDDRADVRFKNLAMRPFLFTEFDRKTPEGRAAYDKAHRAAHPDHYRASELRRNFGLTLAEYGNMLVAQKGVCAICEQPESLVRRGKLQSLSVDHDHSSAAVRGLLCNDCNLMVGHARENRDTLVAAVRYLDKHAGVSKPAVVAMAKGT